CCKDIMSLRAWQDAVASRARASSSGTCSSGADVAELVALVKKADALVRVREAQETDIARTSDAIKENRYLQARVEEELQRRQDANRSQLDDIRRQNDELRRRLESLLQQ